MVEPLDYFIIKQVFEEQKKYINSSTDRVSYNIKKVQRHPIKLPTRIKDIAKWLEFNEMCKPLFELQRKNEELINKLEKYNLALIESLPTPYNNE